MVVLAQLFEDRPFLSLLLWLRWRVSCCCNLHVIRDHSSLQLQLGCSLCCTALRMLALCRASWASGTLGFLSLIKLVSWVCGLFTSHLSTVCWFLVLHLYPTSHLHAYVPAIIWPSYVQILSSELFLCSLIFSLDVTYLRFLNGRHCSISFSFVCACVYIYACGTGTNGGQGVGSPGSWRSRRVWVTNGPTGNQLLEE